MVQACHPTAEKRLSAPIHGPEHGKRQYTMPRLCSYVKAQWDRVTQAWDFPSFLPLTLCWDDCVTWAFWSRKWRVGSNTSMFSCSLSPFPVTRTHIKDNLTCIVHRISLSAIFAAIIICFSFCLWSLSSSPDQAYFPVPFEIAGTQNTIIHFTKLYIYSMCPSFLALVTMMYFSWNQEHQQIVLQSVTHSQEGEIGNLLH